MEPIALLGVATQWIKSVTLPPRLAKYQPLIAFVLTAAAGTALYAYATPNAFSADWRTFISADWAWINTALGTSQTISMAMQQGVNLGAFRPESRLILNTATPPAPAAPTGG